MTSSMIQWLIGGPIHAEGHLEWRTEPVWMMVALLVGGLWLLLASVGTRGRWSRILEVSLGAMVILGLIVAICRPLWVEESGRREEGRVVVLVDSSRSMGIIEDGQSRSVAADARLDALVDEHVEIFHFGTELMPGRPSEYDQPGTDLDAALSSLADRFAGERLAGVVLLTDGLDRGWLRKRFQSESNPEGPPELPGPLTIFQIGSPGELHDLAVRSVETGGYAFVRSPFSITAAIEGVGYIGRTVTATLSRDGAPVTSRSVTIGPDGHAQVRFDITPDRAGRFTYAVSLPVYEDDAVPSNGTAPVVVRVVRDRIRVLQVAGAPSWDVKFLRRFLKGDPSVDLVSFFILRTQSDLNAPYDDDELSLIRFPYERLFSEDLSGFDIIVLQNFDYRSYFTGSPGIATTLLGNIRDFVAKDGHALVMTGGDRSFDLGEYADTPLAEILPVTLGAPQNLSDRVCKGLCTTEPFLPELTAEGARHPITRLAADPIENEQFWKRLHPSDGANRVLGPAEGATVLLAHPTEKTSTGAPMPILAVREAGKGRSMALGIDASWRWSFSEAAEGRGNQAYLRFWKNTFRWLVADPSTSRVTVDTARENYAMGDTVRIVVAARDPGFAPISDAKLVAEIRGEGEPIQLEGLTGVDGEQVLEWVADRRGAQRVVVEVTGSDGRKIGAAETVFAVTTRDPELDEVIPDPRFLKWVAESAGGKYIGPKEDGTILRDPNAGRVVMDRRETALGKSPLLMAWIMTAAGLSWWVRRRAGLK